MRGLERGSKLSRVLGFRETNLAQADWLSRRAKERKMRHEEATKLPANQSLRTERNQPVLESLYRALGKGAARAPAAVRCNVERVDDRQGGK